MITSTKYKVITFYKFVLLEDFEELKAPLLSECKKHHLRGSILLAEEGINATIVGASEDIDAVWKYLVSDSRLSDMTYKESFTDEWPFQKMKVRSKKSLVNMGPPLVKPSELAGEHISSEKWNEIISDPETILIDTRNDYEVQVGTFKGAINPNLKSFKELPEYIINNFDPSKDTKVAMFCTGGIRCEKVSSYMLEKGFENVYQLNGGILQYLEDIEEKNSLWEGDCFVFDERVAVNHALEKVPLEICRGCGYVISPEEVKAAPELPKNIYCPTCYHKLLNNIELPQPQGDKTQIEEY